MQDQYISHIMNETGATVSLRGCGAGTSESASEEGNNSSMWHTGLAKFLILNVVSTAYVSILLHCDSRRRSATALIVVKQ